MGEIAIGSPSQNFRLLMDSGSSRVWVRGEGQCEGMPDTCRVFTNLQSVTDLNENSPTIRYGDGSFVEGKWFSGSVGIGPYTAENFHFQLGTHVQDAADEDGILGLGFSTIKGKPTAWESLILKQIPDSPVFSTYIDYTETKGAFIFGGVDTARYRGNIRWADVAPHSGNYWALQINRLQVGGSVLNSDLSKIKFVVDTGTSLGVFPTAIADEIHSLLKLKRIDLGGPSDNYLGFPCPDGVVPSNTDLPILYFFFHNQILTFSANEYLFIYPDNKNQLMCVSGIQASQMDHIIAGNLLLRKYYVAFDQWNRKVGFATAIRTPGLAKRLTPASAFRSPVGAS